MKQTITLAVMFVLASSSAASAGGQEDSLGVGAEFGLNGITGGVSMNYDLGKFHVGGFFGFIDGFDGDDVDEDDTDYTIGARFFYHLHSTAMSDFGVGGTFGLFSIDQADPNDRLQLMFLEPSFQIRLFLAANVALSFTAGITLGFVDADGIAIGAPSVGTADGTFGGVVSGSAGVHYYFF